MVSFLQHLISRKMIYQPSRHLTVHWQPTMLKLHRDSSFTPAESQNCHVRRTLLSLWERQWGKETFPIIVSHWLLAQLQILCFSVHSFVYCPTSHGHRFTTMSLHHPAGISDSGLVLLNQNVNRFVQTYLNDDQTVAKRISKISHGEPWLF